jgi:hypothetical protein
VDKLKLLWLVEYKDILPLRRSKHSYKRCPSFKELIVGFSLNLSLKTSLNLFPFLFAIALID